MNYEPYVLSTILANPKQFAIAQEIISAEDFDLPVHQEIWYAMETIAGDSILPSPRLVAGKVGDDARVAVEVLELESRQSQVEPLARKLVEQSRKSRLLQAIEEAKQADDVATALDHAVDAYRSRQESKIITMKDMLMDTANYLTAVHEGLVGVPSSLPCINERVNGYRGGQLVIVAARPSVGKTALTIQDAVFAAKQGVAGGICSLEMSEPEIGMRMMANEFSIDLNDLIRAEPDVLAEIPAKVAHTKFHELPLQFNCDTYELSAIVNQIRIWHKHNDIKFAVVDHIGLVEVPHKREKRDKVGEVTRTLKKLAKELDIPIIAVSQLNRDNTKNNRLPQLSDLRDTGEVEQDANIAIFLHDDDGVYRIGLLKNRNGPKGWISNDRGLPLDVQFIGKYQRIRHEPQGEHV